jgi:hypothetical protein
VPVVGADFLPKIYWSEAWTKEDEQMLQDLWWTRDLQEELVDNSHQSERAMWKKTVAIFQIAPMDIFHPNIRIASKYRFKMYSISSSASTGDGLRGLKRLAVVSCVKRW